MKININLRSESGLIKVPSRMCKEAKELVRSKLISYIIYKCSKLEELDNIVQYFVRICQLEHIEIINELDVIMSVKYIKTYGMLGLPKTYYKLKPFDVNPSIEHPDVIKVSLCQDVQHGSINDEHELKISVSAIDRLLIRPKYVTIKQLSAAISRLLSSVEHELMHYVQINYLHRDSLTLHEITVEDSAESRRVKYYTSLVEFLPQIKTAIDEFWLELDSDQTPFQKDFLRKFTDSIEPLRANRVWFKQSTFFKVLKRHKPVAYKRALKIFTENVLNTVHERNKRDKLATLKPTNSTMRLATSESGLIKVPEQLHKNVERVALTKILSHVIYITDGLSSRERVFNEANKLLHEYNFELLTIDRDIYLPTVIQIVRKAGELPKSYHNMDKPRQKVISVELDNIKQGSIAYFAPPNIITLCTSPIRSISQPDSPTFGKVRALIDDYRNAIKHELMHYVQHNYLHDANNQQHYKSRDVTDNKVKYYISPVEFSPTIHTDVENFVRLMRGYSGKVKFNNLIAYYTCSIDPFAIAYPGFAPSEFFDILKRYKHSAYVKALRIFVPLVKQRLE